MTHIRLTLTIACLAILNPTETPLRAQSEDQPVRVTRRFEPTYPGSAITRGIGQGYAKVYFWVDELGEASDFVIVAHNGEWFGKALVEAVDDWQFEPKIENGGPVGSVYNVEWHFHPKQAIELNAMQAASKKFQKDSNLGDVQVLTVDPEQLDSPVALREVYPIYVDKKDFDRVSLDIEFFIDEEGNVRLPRILDEEISERERLALERFRKWKFEAPVKDGEPTLVSMHKRIIVPVVEIE